MPKPQKILEGLQSIADKYSIYATVWHGLAVILFIGLASGFSPTGSTVAILLSLPLFSVSLFAWITKNPFNGAVFTVLSLIILLAGIRSEAGEMLLSSPLFMIAGITMIIFGLVYPHFIRSKSIFSYLLRSPFGLIPCPTLSTVVGFALLFDGLENGIIVLSISFAGLFYGFFGMLRLKVYIDAVLAVGSLTLLVKFLIS